MISAATLILALLVYIGAALFAYRDALQPLRKPRPPSTDAPDPGPTPAMRLLATVALIVLGGVLVLAGSSLVFDSGNIAHSVPLDRHEFVQLMKDVVPGLVSVVLGFLILEASNRTFNGRGLRHG